MNNENIQLFSGQVLNAMPRQMVDEKQINKKFYLIERPCQRVDELGLHEYYAGYDVTHSVDTYTRDVYEAKRYTSEIQALTARSRLSIMADTEVREHLFTTLLYKVQSSMIAAYGYDENEQNLYIKFNSGGTYKYEPVSEKVVNAFIAAESKGKYFLANIKDFAGYSYEQV